ncbi:MAG: hypothetical protein ACE5O2_03855, partial [Armatimonadota bacterium]
GFSQDAERMTRRLVAAMQARRVDIIAHPTGRLIGKREAYGVNIEEVLEAAAETQTALEVNCYPERLDLNDAHCRLAKEMGVKIAICTDAHSTTMLDYMRLGVMTAARGWIEPEDVINTSEPEELLRWLRRRQ